MNTFKLKRLVKAKNRRCLDISRPEIYSIPVDVLLYLMRMLSPADAAALALSSKTILDLVGRQVIKLDWNDRIELLQREEYSLPRRRLCHRCASFHPRHCLPKKVLSREVAWTPCDKSSVFYGLCSLIPIPFSLVQEIMNRHRYGKEHGPSVKILRTGRYPDKWSKTAEARIVDGELILQMEVKRSFDYKGGAERDKIAAFTEELRYCPHLTTFNINSTLLFSRCQEQGCEFFVRCFTCQTEIRFKFVSWGHLMCFDGEDGEAQTTAWYNLGSCHDPLDPKWVSVTEQQPSAYPDGRYITRAETKYYRLFMGR